MIYLEETEDDFPKIHPNSKNAETMPEIIKNVAFKLKPKKPQIMRNPNIRIKPVLISNILSGSTVVYIMVPIILEQMISKLE